MSEMCATAVTPPPARKTPPLEICLQQLLDIESKAGVGRGDNVSSFFWSLPVPGPRFIELFLSGTISCIFIFNKF